MFGLPFHQGLESDVEPLEPGEIVRDDFTLPRLPDKTQVRFGLYEQDTSGQFVNYGETVLPVAACGPHP